MNKRICAALCSLLCLLLAVVSCGVPVFAAQEEAAETTPAAEEILLEIADEMQFLQFVQNCRIDSYSKGLTVLLKADLDLSGYAFESIPIFCGTFRGNSHTIQGVTLTAAGSAQGLFRYLTQEAVVTGLTVKGEICPDGSQRAVGGIAGENAGYIAACSFYGSVAGGEQVGGIVGVNTVSGVIESCRMGGTLQGLHFAGGIAGQNAGVIRDCLNTAAINTTAQQNAVEINDITLDTLTGTESSNTVTDIGGIAGSSSGIIRSCRNKGDVGYPHMGYNMGGIAGSQTGYIVDCVNYGQIQGRKEAGGIVGHLEPVARLEFSQDTLQILQGQLDTVSRTADRAAANARSSVAGLQQQLTALRDQAAGAAAQAEQLRPKLDLTDPELPDRDSLQALRNSLTGSMTAISGTMSGIAASTQNAGEAITADLQMLIRQMEAVDATLSNAQEHLGGSVADVSDADTAEDTTAEVENCRNLAAIASDLNAGGIAGAIAPESDLDPEEDLTIGGSASLNFAGELRAVVRGCENTGRITVKRQNAGGIVGWQSMGLVRECRSSGALDAADAEYVGGIVGRSDGFLRVCSANCAVVGKSKVGGVAGSGSIVTDCRSMVQISGGEKTGAILGTAVEPLTGAQSPRSGNLYLPVGTDRGGIDGVSYEGVARPLPLEAFLALEELDDMFRYVTLFFTFEDGSEQTLRLPAGSDVTADTLPPLPEKAGYAAHWVCLEGEELTNVLFDRHFNAVYVGYDKVIASENADENGMPLLLAAGDFSTAAVVTVEVVPSAAEPDVLPPLAERENLLGRWRIAATEGDALRTGRLLLPADAAAADSLRLWTQDGWGWRERSFTVDGSYIVFDLDGDTGLLALVSKQPLPWLYIGAAGAAAAVLIIGICSAVRKKQKKKKAQKPSA